MEFLTNKKTVFHFGTANTSRSYFKQLSVFLIQQVSVSVSGSYLSLAHPPARYFSLPLHVFLHKYVCVFVLIEQDWMIIMLMWYRIIYTVYTRCMYFPFFPLLMLLQRSCFSFFINTNHYLYLVVIAFLVCWCCRWCCYVLMFFVKMQITKRNEEEAEKTTTYTQQQPTILVAMRLYAINCTIILE